MREVSDQHLEEEGESEITLTPMLDVVFIMLIFFIVTSVFVKDPGAEVLRPQATTALSADKASIFIAVTSDDEIWIDRRRVDEAGARLAIERLHTEYPEGGVVIQADSDAHNQAVIAVMDAAKTAGILDITLAASVR